jgi:enoyl-CoA hydratase
LRLGLVSEVFEDAAAFDAHVQRLAALPPLALANIKRAVFEGLEAPLEKGLALERDLIEQLFRSQDAGEGLKAFSEKRAPEFTGA